MFSKVLKERVEYVYMPPQTQNDTNLTKRSNSDVMNNFYIEIVARSFTDIEEVIFSKFET
jgi:hypothetical protein